MVYEKDIVGKYVTLRSITLEDTEFSFLLRKDPRFVDVMGQPAETIEEQKKFIEWQRKQPGDYYFVVYNKNEEKIGLIGAYDVDGDTCETGREINVGNPYEIMEAELLLFYFRRDVLGMKYNMCVVYKNNPNRLKSLRNIKDEYKKDVIRSGVPSVEVRIPVSEEEVSMKKVEKLLNKLEGR